MLKVLKALTQKRYQDRIPCSFAYKFVCVDDKFSKPIFVFRGKSAAFKFIEAIFNSIIFWVSVLQKIMKKHFKNNFIMTEEEERFQSCNMCWILEKLIDDEKVRDHYYISKKFRGAAHCCCHINLQLTKKVTLTFHNFRGYDSHLIFCEINKFDVKIDVIPNGLGKYMAFL